MSTILLVVSSVAAAGLVGIYDSKYPATLDRLLEEPGVKDIGSIVMKLFLTSGSVLGAIQGWRVGSGQGGMLGSLLGGLLGYMVGCMLGGALGLVLALVVEGALTHVSPVIWTASQKHPTEAPDNDRPPLFAEYLLYFLPKTMREPLLGDLEEEYREVYARFGRRKATVWYYAQVGLSYWPLLCRAARKLVKWGVLGWLGGAVRRLIS